MMFPIFWMRQGEVMYIIQAHIANWGKNRNLKPGLSAPEFGVHRNKMLSAEVAWRGSQFWPQNMSEKARGYSRPVTEGLTENPGVSRHFCLTPLASF